MPSMPSRKERAREIADIIAGRTRELQEMVDELPAPSEPAQISRTSIEGGSSHFLNPDGSIKK